jgi:hypothetical protein
MVRRLAAALAGVLLFAVVAFAINRLMLAAWPAYAAAFPSQDFTTGMLLARLATAVAALFGAGYAAARIAKGERIAVVIAAAALLALGGAIHLTEPTWSTFPLWYHLAFIGGIAPCVLIAGRWGRSTAG